MCTGERKNYVLLLSAELLEAAYSGFKFDVPVFFQSTKRGRKLKMNMCHPDFRINLPSLILLLFHTLN